MGSHYGSTLHLGLPAFKDKAKPRALITKVLFSMSLQSLYLEGQKLLTMGKAVISTHKRVQETWILNLAQLLSNCGALSKLINLFGSQFHNDK